MFKEQERSLLNAIADVVQDICIQIYLSHYLDLSGSHDVIGHVTIRFSICHFLVVLHWYQASISNGFRDISSKYICATTLTFKGLVTSPVT